jgi:hypothetical protein
MVDFCQTKHCRLTGLRALVTYSTLLHSEIRKILYNESYYVKYAEFVNYLLHFDFGCFCRIELLIGPEIPCN